MSVPRLSPAEALALLHEGYTYLDVRSESEFAEGHPEGAVNVPWRVDGPIGTLPNEAFLDVVARAFGEEARLVVGCHSGGRSRQAAAALAAQGFRAIVEQRAGWDGARGAFGEIVEPGWRRQGLTRSTAGTSYAALLASLERALPVAPAP
ncbi:MAG: rhodanese-like domain-containing protein [Myxococcales bacterium]|nr:rhodanese-like domain-containing protein [Myxococcales bacterium]MBL0194265.1 rhodanese-like domain-containing protein [Myxococcales bacterium]